MSSRRGGGGEREGKSAPSQWILEGSGWLDVRRRGRRREEDDILGAVLGEQVWGRNL